MYKVIKDFNGSPDGANVIAFKIGDSMSIQKHGEDLINVALAEKWIVADKPPASPKSPEQLKAAAQKKVDGLTKSLSKAKPENKAKLQEELDKAVKALEAFK
ncbi:cytochrome P450 [Methylovorus menthalis]|uniref:cytochrome P450 n=1 Tax=Methylovorus menthalis TaxID=1002227 RepID=UPI001E5562F6|nr:cytochrome P450 [Methylovorus menthalis]MCB4811691.1 cytochrome P450 [Methylovorus menthalis]